jgi:cyclopropane-fatty-acyl-phospholipid synthase
MLFRRLLESIVRTGDLRLIDATGRTHAIGDGAPPCITIRLHARHLDYKLALNPGLFLGEAYMDGLLTIEKGSLFAFYELIARNMGSHGVPYWLTLIERISAGIRQHNPVARAKRNVAHHYDLTGRLFEIFLDRDRQYSCAYFTAPTDSLETAQENKKRHIAAKLLLDRPGLRILDIGSGWGGLCLYLARMANACVTGVTLSSEQHRFSQARAAIEGLHDRVHFALRDYREENGPYDRIVSVGMFEHVGKRNYDEFFAKLRVLLAEDGVALLHSIGYSDAPTPINPFIRKYVFPGAAIPSLSEVLAAVERSGLIVTDLEILRLHYAETLHHWRRRFTDRWHIVAEMYDERFCRMWEFYLVLCEIAFRFRTSMVFQIQLTKRFDTVPTTRDYMFDWERTQPTLSPELQVVARV